MSGYREVYQHSLADPDSFWAQAASRINWITKPRRILDEANPPLYRWFPDAALNTCFNALDRHVIAGRGEHIALICDSPLAGTHRSYSYIELTELTAKFAGVLRRLGVAHGDRVLIYLPMVGEAVIAMLACARIGAVHSVVFGGFAATELAARIDDARPKVIVSASCGLEPTRIVAYKPLLDEALLLAHHQPDQCIILQRPQAQAEMTERDLDFQDLLDETTIHPAECATVAATDPLYILYTSGTTGRPKGIVRDNGGHAVALAWTMANIFNVGPGEVIFTASDVGWVVGHSYIVYAPLLAGATSVLYEGKPVGTPDAGAFARIIDDYRVSVLFTAPTAIRAIKRLDPQGAALRSHDTSSLRTVFLAGERLDPDTYEWLTAQLGVAVVDNWWQTETGWPIAASPRGIETLPLKPGSPSLPMPGYDVVILDDAGQPLPAGEQGAICLRLPLPPGTLAGIWGSGGWTSDDQAGVSAGVTASVSVGLTAGVEVGVSAGVTAGVTAATSPTDRYVDSYLRAYEGYYLTGDGGYLDDEGYLFVLGRTDDVMNVAGHRLSSGQLEAALASHPAVAECAVIGVRDEVKGQVPRAFVVTKSDYARAPEALAIELQALVRGQVGAFASVSRIDIVDGLPKTRSGKLLRKTMRQMADGDDAPVPSTIEDPRVLDALRPILRSTPPASVRPESL